MQHLAAPHHEDTHCNGQLRVAGVMGENKHQNPRLCPAHDSQAVGHWGEARHSLPAIIFPCANLPLQQAPAIYITPYWVHPTVPMLCCHQLVQ